MRWAIFGQNDLLPLQSFVQGLGRFGSKAFWREHTDWSNSVEEGFDAVAIYGLRQHGRDILNAYRAENIPVVVIDHGYMNRVNVEADFGRGYFQIGINRLGWVPDEVPSDDRFIALGVEPTQGKPTRISKALICGQVEYDASHNMTAVELEGHYEAIAAELEARGVTVSFRGHPLARSVRPRLRLDPPRRLSEALSAHDVIVSVNSNAGLDALIAGKPVIRTRGTHYDHLAYRWPAPIQMIKAPEVSSVRAHLVKLAYAQWTAAEISRGEALNFLFQSGALRHGR